MVYAKESVFALKARGHGAVSTPTHDLREGAIRSRA
jgi:hypothetical protein